MTFNNPSIYPYGSGDEERRWWNERQAHFRDLEDQAAFAEAIERDALQIMASTSAALRALAIKLDGETCLDTSRYAEYIASHFDSMHDDTFGSAARQIRSRI